MPNRLVWHVGNRDPSIAETITSDGVAVNLTGKTVKFKMRAVGSSTLTVDKAATVVSAADGTVRYDWDTPDVSTAGTFIVWWEVTTTASGKTQDMGEALIEIRAHSPDSTAYITELEQLKSTLSITGTFADDDLRTSIRAASRALDQTCGRRFWSDANATNVRTYTPDSWRRLMVDDLITLTTLKVDQDGDGTYEETWTVNTDFVLEPLNAAVESPARPYESAVTRKAARKYFPVGLERSVQVTGKFGWAAIPDEIVTATEILAGMLFKRKREAQFGILSFGIESGVAVRIARTDPQIATLIDGYIRRTPFI